MSEGNYTEDRERAEGAAPYYPFYEADPAKWRVDLSDPSERERLRARAADVRCNLVHYPHSDGYAPPESCAECGEEWPCAWEIARSALDLIENLIAERDEARKSVAQTHDVLVHLRDAARHDSEPTSVVNVRLPRSTHALLNAEAEKRCVGARRLILDAIERLIATELSDGWPPASPEHEDA
jgi:hypothetical protein